MTEQDVLEIRCEITKANEFTGTLHFTKIGLLLLAELVLAVYQGIRVLSKLESKIV